jgi:hypothetical protein
MLHLPITQARWDRGVPGGRARSDRAMVVLQYATAGLALVVVVLLAVFR